MDRVKRYELKKAVEQSLPYLFFTTLAAANLVYGVQQHVLFGWETAWYPYLIGFLLLLIGLHFTR